MIYLFYGNNYLINEEIKIICKKHDIDDINITKFIDNDYSKIISACNTYSMFSKNKLIIWDDFKIDDNLLLQEYLNNPNPQTILIIISRDILDERKKIVKEIKTKVNYKEFKDIDNTFLYLKNKLKDYEINDETINFLIKIVGNDLYNLDNEIDKIINYLDDNKITKDIVNNVCTNNSKENIFSLQEAIIKKDKKNALRIYEELIKNGEENIKILISLANEFRLIYQTKNLLLNGYNEKQIADKLKIHPYRIKLAKEKGGKYNNDILIKYLEELANIDLLIKSGKSSPYALELFIINME